MTLLIKLVDGNPVDNPVIELNFRQLFSNTSFPDYLTPSIVEAHGFGIYDYSPQPEVNRYEKVIEIKPSRDSAGIWRQTWQIVEMGEDDKETVNNEQAIVIRTDRNYRLWESDWTQLADSTANKEVWAAYRQALRDITKQVGFPWIVQWPEKPN